ncbi:glycoside hydrolase family 20 protein [Lentithecium fluviatile CBS 122367]|uniref:beta-N-acetylhexosaminidase n=1 Tax=Lentithecium fluviatile CBS 122367 TaxID=1168545 RepID=A0A6G1J8N4_9PLEO|nr:glycoside hydrolase family 20 protein [Lentithecium fluviatile CBS 122367]
MILWCVCSLLGAVAALPQPLPPVQWTRNSSTGNFVLGDAPKTIYIESSFADITDTEGLTLIPPSAAEFAETFREDISQLTRANWTLQQVESFPAGGIFLGQYRADASQLTYENGVSTEEGYELEIGDGTVFIGGTGARGMFWGTRTLLQELVIADGSPLQAGRTVDAPAYATRGYMLDAGRKWYTASFLKELCAYASFFKMSEFHYHSSDNYPLNRGHNETWNKVFSHFSLRPEAAELQGIIQRPNETLSRSDFEDFQNHCALRGVTVIPEIEAPGHCLSITKWKPELALAKKDLLNLSHPDAIPTVKAIWSEFLPWFQTKEVHIGADEYDPTLADDYISFVNEMSGFVNSTSGKRIRIWGTHEPSENLTVSRDIIIQHWQYGQSDPVQLQNDGYGLVNSEDWWAYMSLKNDHMPILPAPYPQFYNVTRTVNFANEPGWQWDPSLFNPVNTTEQLEPGASGNKGAILAAWSDSGPDATTQLEGYYAMRDGIPVVAARAWSGRRGVNISAEDLPTTLDALVPMAPGQNLERRLAAPSIGAQSTTPLLSWTRGSGYAANTSMGHGSYGPPYTLTLTATSPFTLIGPETTLSINTVPSNISANGTSTLVFTTADNFPYPLRSTSELDGHDPGHPGRIWTNASSSPHHPVPVTFPAKIRITTDVVNGSRVWVDDGYKGRFEVFVFGGRNTLFSWSQMALVAPLDKVKGGLESLVLEAGIDGKGVAGNGNGTQTGPVPPVGSGVERVSVSLLVVMGTLGIALAAMGL